MYIFELGIASKLILNIHFIVENAKHLKLLIA